MNTVTQGKKNLNLTHWDAIIIGSGMGGMSCASALAKFGRKVLVLEQHYVAGGMTHTFKRKGMIWDVGVHCLGEMEKNRIPGKMLSWLGDDGIVMNKYDHIYDTFIFPGNWKFELPASSEDYRNALLDRFPDEKKAIDEYMDLIRHAARSARELFKGRAMPLWLEPLLWPMVGRKFDKWALQTTKQVLDKLTDNVKLKSVLAGQWGYYGVPPSQSSFFIHACTVRHFWNGGFYPKGSAKTMAENILRPVAQAGGHVQTRAAVKEILLKDGKAYGVILENGDQVFADIVVSGVGAIATVENLLPESEKKQPWSKSIANLKQSPCHVCLYLAFEGDITKLGATKSNQWFYEHWNLEKNLWDLNDPNSEAPCLYVSYPSLKDPDHDAGDQNKHTGEIVTFVPWECFSKWKETKVGRRGDDYKEFKKDIQERLFNQFKKHRPELAEKVIYQELSTPLSTTHYCRAPQGAIYGLAPTPKRFSCRYLRPKTPVKGLYLTGADVGTLGVVGALMGGVLTAANIERKVLDVLYQKSV